MSYFFNFDKIAYLQGKKPEGCILCHIKNKSKDIVNLTVYEDGLFNISVNLYPYNPGHLIIFPLRHIIDVREMNEKESERLNILTNRSLDILDSCYSPSGYNVGYNMGLTAGASIEHIHLHIIPRFPRETGIADLIAGSRMLVENPLETKERIKKCFSALPQIS
jgi:ATP adenylyltransferase